MPFCSRPSSCPDVPFLSTFSFCNQRLAPFFLLPVHLFTTNSSRSLRLICLPPCDPNNIVPALPVRPSLVRDRLSSRLMASANGVVGGGGTACTENSNSAALSDPSSNQTALRTLPSSRRPCQRPSLPLPYDSPSLRTGPLFADPSGPLPLHLQLAADKWTPPLDDLSIARISALLPTPHPSSSRPTVLPTSACLSTRRARSLAFRRC